VNIETEIIEYNINGGWIFYFWLLDELKNIFDSIFYEKAYNCSEMIIKTPAKLLLFNQVECK
jgi:hypothetical protein